MLVASAAPPFPPRSFASLRKGCQPAGIALPTAVTRVRATHHRSRTLGIKTIMPGVARATSFKRSVRRTSPCHTARQRSGVSSSRHTTPAPSVPQSPNPPQPLARFSRARRALPCVGPRRVTWPFHFIHGDRSPLQLRATSVCARKRHPASYARITFHTLSLPAYCLSNVHANGIVLFILTFCFCGIW